MFCLTVWPLRARCVITLKPNLFFKYRTELWRNVEKNNKHKLSKKRGESFWEKKEIKCCSHPGQVYKWGPGRMRKICWVPRGGGGALPYWRWRGRAAGQGMIFTVIHIDTWYLNRPNWLLAGYSVYHRVASRASAGFPAHNVYDRPAISAPATARAGRNIFLWMYDDTQQNRESVRTSTGYAYESFSKVYYYDRVRFSTPPAAPPPRSNESRVPPPPPRPVTPW